MQGLLDSISREDLLAVAAVVLPRVAAALAVLAAFWLGFRIIRRPLRAVLEKADFAETLVKLLVDGVLHGVLLVLGIVMAASQLGINVGAALAGIGIVGIALGFAAQETVANMIAGFLIFWDRPFKVGDWITTQDKYGEVREITLRTTRLRTRNNTYVVIPNKQVIGDLLVNHSMYGETRVIVPIGIAYKEKIAEARKVILAAVTGLEGVLDDPAPSVVASALGDSSVNLNVRVWIGDAEQEMPTGERVLEACKVALDEAGIEIPFPHLQLFVENVEDRVWQRGGK